MTRDATEPGGRRWRVTRRWVTRNRTETWWGRFRRRVRKTFGRAGDAAEVGGWIGDLSEGIALGIGVVLIVVLALFLVVPLLLVVVDLLIVVLLALAGGAARILLRRPWTVEATADDGTRVRWRVVGWSASGAWRDDVARRLTLGELPPDGETTTTPSVDSDA